MVKGLLPLLGLVSLACTGPAPALKRGNGLSVTSPPFCFDASYRTKRGSLGRVRVCLTSMEDCNTARRKTVAWGGMANVTQIWDCTHLE